MKEKELRNALAKARRVVVKIGSRVLVKDTGRPDLPRMCALIDEIAAQHHAGREIVVVTSGAIGAGMEALGMKKRPKALPDLQMAAAVGQTRLMTRYDQFFSAEGCQVGQVLLTHDALRQRDRHLCARNTLMNLLRNRIIPVINENDAVAVEEIKFGDNDLLASLVSLLVEADLLILLTTVNGLLAPAKPGGRPVNRIPYLPDVTEKAISLAVGKGSELSTGGMASKLQSAATVVSNGGTVVIADGRQPGVIGQVLAGADTGTLIRKPEAATGTHPVDARRQWIAYFHKVAGALVVDEGARGALAEKGRSLLPIGVRDVEGSFGAGAVVDVRTQDGAVIARGLSEYSAADIRAIMGHPTADLQKLLGRHDYDEVIHRDNMVVFATAGGEPT